MRQLQRRTGGGSAGSRKGEAGGSCSRLLLVPGTLCNGSQSTATRQPLPVLAPAALCKRRLHCSAAPTTVVHTVRRPHRLLLCGSSRHVHTKGRLKISCSGSAPEPQLGLVFISRRPPATRSFPRFTAAASSLLSCPSSAAASFCPPPQLGGRYRRRHRCCCCCCCCYR